MGLSAPAALRARRAAGGSAGPRRRAGVQHARDSPARNREPPGFYLPPEDVDTAQLAPAPGRSICEWKGAALYWRLANDPAGQPIGWSYPAPHAAFAALAGYFAFYPGRVACFVNDERVAPQPGGFYGD